jgi:tetratricopeptide (TPR) repeat protein
MSTNVPDANSANPGTPNVASENQTASGVVKPTPPTVSSEGLPEFEPLTPEFVEEEAIRGDFVLKWAVILLAVLLGSTLVSDTTTLVHVKTGQYLAAHGFLPPAHDLFSASAGDHRWVNLSWLFDLILAGFYGIGKFIGLSALKAILAGLAFGFVAHTSKPGVSTWWGSICAALAVLVCQPQFTAQPEVVTLLGIALLLWLLHQAVWSRRSQLLWLLIPVCAVWSNLDERAWWGPYLLALYGIGEFLGSLVGRSTLANASQRKTLWLAVAGSWLGLLINPFLWQSWLAPVTQFNTTYPLLRGAYSGRYGLYLDSYPLLLVQGLSLETSPALFREPLEFGVGYFLFVVAIATLILNFRRLSFGHLLMFFGAVVPVLLAVHELPAAALVMCILATINGQIWYSEKFARVYSIEVSALLFSRGGRAVTVLGLFLLALLFTFGRLQMSNDRAPGWGLDTELDGVLKSYETVLKDAPDGGVFNFTPDQGDVLIWLGRKPFVDHRMAVFAGKEEASNLILMHLNLRNALVPQTVKGEIAGQDEKQFKFWREEFDRFHINYAMPRLTSSPPPDYRTFLNLSSQRIWQLTRLSAATAVYCRLDVDSPELKEFAIKNRFDLGRSVFKTEAELLPTRDAWPQLPTFYQQYVWKQDRRVSVETREARHRLNLASQVGERGVGLVYQAIRRCQESLARNVNDTNAFQLLGEAYVALLNIESPGDLNSAVGRMRYLQAVQALNLALVASPDNVSARTLLVQMYGGQRKSDLELRELQAIMEIINRQPTNSLEEDRRRIQELELYGQQIDVVRKRIEQVEQQADKLPKEAQAERFQMGLYYAQAGMVLKALELLQPDDSEVAQAPQEMMVRAQLLLEAGQTEEANEITARLDGIAQQMEIPGWQQNRVISLLSSGEYSAAAQILVDVIKSMDRQSLQTFLDGFIFRSFELGPQPPAPLNSLQRFSYHLEQVPTSGATYTFQAGLIYLEAGQIKRAKECLQQSLDQFPNQPYRPLIAGYLTFMTDKWVDPVAPGDRVPSDVFPKKE